MTKLMFVLVAGLAMAGCKKKDGADSAAALAKLTAFKDEMCKCKDATCADDVMGRMTKWTQEMSKAGKEPKMSKADEEKGVAIGKDLAACMMTVKSEPGARGSADAKVIADVMATMTGFKDEMCNCKSLDCATGVSDKMTAWAQAQAKNPNESPKMSEEETKKAAALGEEMGKCMQAAAGIKGAGQ
jgi:hypothetical protein